MSTLAASLLGRGQIATEDMTVQTGLGKGVLQPGRSTGIDPLVITSAQTGKVIRMPTAIALDHVAEAYAQAIHRFWPQAEVWVGEPRYPDSVQIFVIADEVELDKERRAYELMWVPEAQAEDVFVDVGVWFRERCEPDLTRFRKLP